MLRDSTDPSRGDASENEVEASTRRVSQETKSQTSYLTAPGREKAQTSHVRGKPWEHKGQLQERNVRGLDTEGLRVDQR